MPVYSLLLATVVLADGPQARSNPDLPPLTGTWEMVSIESAGQKVGGWQMAFTFAGEKLIWSEGGKNPDPDLTTYTIDASKNPKHIDVTFVRAPGTVAEGQTWLGIYSLDGDELKICWSSTGQDRPTEFNGKKLNDWTVFILRRAKP